MMGGSKRPSVMDALQATPAYQQQREMFDAMDRLCEDGVDADELPNGRGEFGLVPSNPIPSRTLYGSTSYLMRLQTQGGEKVAYTRTGSVVTDVSKMPVDLYGIAHPDGRHLAVLYVSPYQKRNSAKAPKGFRLAEPPPQPPSAGLPSPLRQRPSLSLRGVFQRVAGMFARRQ